MYQKSPQEVFYGKNHTQSLRYATCFVCSQRHSQQGNQGAI